MSNKDQTLLDEQILNEVEMEQKQDNSVEVSKIESEAVDSYEKRIAELERQLIELQKGVRDTQLRAQAEIENIRRRADQDMEKVHKFALEKFANELLPVIDNLERALEVADRNNLEMNVMIEGIELTLKSLLSAVRKFGVEVVDEVNIPFNPDIHQAMSVLESNEVEPNHVTMVMQRGYTLNGRLLRPAMVSVAKPKK